MPNVSQINVTTKKRLVRKQSLENPNKYKAWLVGHLMCIGFGIISFGFQLLWLPNKWYINSIAYRLSLLGSVFALVSTVFHKFGLYLPPSSTLIAQQNIQFMILSACWFFTFKSSLKLLPYWLISVLQVSNHFNVKPVMTQADFLASLIAYDELLLVGYLLLRTILFRGTSGFQLVLFCLFYWLRILYNEETANLFRYMMDKLDGRMQGLKNEKVIYYWNKTKAILAQKTQEENVF